MNNLINFEDYQNSDSGCITTEKDGKTTITGVYHKDLVSSLQGSNVYIGEKGDDSINNPVVVSVEDMNQFCIMWLCIFDPSAIVEE
jgi:hypothetical protein